MNQVETKWQVRARLFSLSFTSLFLELMVIRWVPSEVRLVAYYANLMLISSFLGLGMGAMVSQREWRLFQLFGPLFMINVLILMLLPHTILPTAGGEWRFQDVNGKWLAYLALVLIFVFNAITFVPFGAEIGKQFNRLPALQAYSWDLGGSLSGTLFFGAFSLLHFSPVLGMALVVLLVLVLSSWRERLWAAPCCAVALAAVLCFQQSGAYWSPYYFITIWENRLDRTPATQPGQPDTLSIGEQRAGSDVPADVRTMIDPPVYTVKVNQDFYQMHGTLDADRYSPGGWKRDFVTTTFAQYSLPYQLPRKVDRVLVLGAGGGMDVETGLINGAKIVDAVEIDPVIPHISDRISAAAPYSNPKYAGQVLLHNDDARAFLQKTTDSYDMVVFGFLDSQALFSYGASLRLDGYTYTIESFRKAFEHVRDGGVMSVSFFVGRDWMARKLVQMIEKATGQNPLVYVLGQKLVIITPKGTPANVPKVFAGWQLVNVDKTPVDLASDDWPYLYLHARGIPTDYLIVIGLLLVISIASLLMIRGTEFGANDTHFLFMGWGFLLLQTKSIGDCSLYFGTTWFVTTLVITGVLLMVLIANWVAIHFIESFSPLLYIPLFLALAMLLAVPRQAILSQDFSIRLIWTLIVVPLPIFFAGLIFSTTFREGANAATLFGANLIGATIGGFCEYLGMWIGSDALSYIVIAAYGASLVFLTISRRLQSSIGFDDA